MPSDFLVFTDLDGTLLDYSSYSFEAAIPALRLIGSKNIPLIICTSKTRAEIELYRSLLDNQAPFISENGGAIFIPDSYFPYDFDYDKEVDGYKIIELGTPHNTLIEVLNSIKKDAGVNLKGLSEMTIEELSEVSGLNKEEAGLARKREYDEPFITYGDEGDKERVKKEITRRGFRHTEGGIFQHIMGENDKGGAVKTLIDIFKVKFSGLKTIGIGDSLNDLPMLEAVDIPVLVQKPDGQYDPRIKLDNLILAEGVGPEGWNKVVLGLLE
ncbi:MAG TPA: HAD-IIB family hydrolase [Thermodesulfobacteriota bacterium]|nr:HAD-IIB family hydrolase [Thermodesulfobacteriota bacterium]